MTYVEATEEYRAAATVGEKKQVKKDAFNEWMTYLLLINPDQTKYGNLLTTLSSQYSMKKNQYPKTILDTTDILKNHKHDDVESKKKGKNKDQEKNKTSPENETPPPSVILPEPV